MNKEIFLTELEKHLSEISKNDRKQWLDYYSEMIDDRTEDGLSEEEALLMIGSPIDISQQIKSEQPLAKLVGQRIKPKRKLRAWEIVLLVLGFPIWGSILISLAAVVLCLYISAWALIISLWAAELSFAASGVAGVLAFIPVGCLQGNYPSALFLLGAGLVLIGLSVFFFFACKALTKGFCKATKALLRSVKTGLSKPRATR